MDNYVIDDANVHYEFTSQTHLQSIKTTTKTIQTTHQIMFSYIKNMHKQGWGRLWALPSFYQIIIHVIHEV
jgi:ribosomal silencing factor RsfS